MLGHVGSLGLAGRYDCYESSREEEKEREKKKEEEEINNKEKQKKKRIMELEFWNREQHKTK